MQENLGERIVRIRRERGMTQAQLAQRLYVTPQAVSKWERNLSQPDAETLKKLSEVLQVSSDELLGMPSGTGRQTAASPRIVLQKPVCREEPVKSRYFLYGALIFYLIVFFLALFAGATMTPWLCVAFALPFAVAVIAFLICKERSRSGVLGKVYLLYQIVYLFRYAFVTWSGIPAVAGILFGMDMIFLVTMMTGFRYRTGYASSCFSMFTFWLSVAAAAVVVIFGIWNVATVAAVTDGMDAIARIFIGEFFFMIYLSLLNVATETRTVLVRQ